MAKTIPQYRQEKYDKYDSREEGKLFYRHEKNLDLVNTVEEIVYVLQEENPWIRIWWKKEIQGHANKFPSIIQPQILKKIEEAYSNGLLWCVRNADILVHKFLKRKFYNNDVKEFLWRYMPGFDHQIQKDLSYDLQCFAYGGVPVFFFGKENRISFQHILKDTERLWGFLYNNAIFMPREGELDSELIYNHEYQHYLFNNFLMNISKDKKLKNIHYRIIDEICARLTHEDVRSEIIINRISSYIYDFCKIDDIAIQPTASIGSIPSRNIKATKEGVEVKDHNQLKDIWLFLMLMPEYVQIACSLINFFESNPRFQIDKQKAIRLLSMTSPHYRKDLIKYYTKIAKHMKEKKISTPS